MNFEEFILFAREKGASDIHLTAGSPTVFRINGKLVRFSDMKEEVVNRTILALLSAEQESRLGEGEDIDFTFELSTGARQRVNVFRQSGKLACSIRLLNQNIPSLESLGLPPVMQDLAMKHRGLILVTGPTGSGKSTTLAAIVDFINQNRACHIITIEDPIEYRYASCMATIHQRELGRDVSSFSYALRSALREDPDVILVGEMRDYETISQAVTAAETGHLVLATLHTTGAAQTVDRIVDACPPHIQPQMKAQLSMVLQAVLSQSLIPQKDGNGRIAALEIMIGTDAIQNLIRQGKTHQIESTMQSSLRYGMVTLNDSLIQLAKQGKITKDVALEYANDKEHVAKGLGIALDQY